MIGVLAFVAAGMTMVVLVWVRGRLDLGARERRLLGSDEVPVWQWFARFEARGGRVQDLEALPTGDALRSWTMGWRAAAQVIVGVALAAGAFALGWPAWIAMAGILFLAVVNALGGEYAVFVANPLAERWRYTGEWPLLAAGILAKSVLFCTGLTCLWLGGTFVVGGQLISAAVAVGAGVAVIDNCHLPARAIERRIRARNQAMFADSATYSSILYLRSFDDDSAHMYAPVAHAAWHAPLLPRRVRFEECIEAWTLGQADGVVAIGRPGERRPVLGAQRTYWTDETWQEAVRHTAARCRAIILVAGTSDGLKWEIEQLARMNVLSKTLLLLPPDTPENSRLRYERIARATNRVNDVLVDDLHALSTIPALGYTPEGDLVHYVSCGRDWASYVLAEMHLLATISGTGAFDEAGNLSQLFTRADDPVEQARYAVTYMADPGLARSLLDQAEATSPSVSGTERDRLLVANAAVLLAGCGDRTYVRETLLQQAGWQASGAGLVGLACERLDEPSTTAATLFDLVVAGNPQQPDGSARVERAPFRVQISYQLLFASLVAQLGSEEAQDALSTVAELRQLGVDAGLQLLVATADAQAAAVLSALGRADEARSLATDVIGRDLPSRLKVGRMTTTASEVRDMAVDVLLDLVEGDLDQGRAERVHLLEQQRSWQLADGLRREAAVTARGIAYVHLDGEEYEDALRWAQLAVNEFAALGLPGEQAETITIIARTDLDSEQWEAAMTHAQQAVALAELNAFDDLRGDPLYVLAEAAWRRALVTGASADWQIVVEACSEGLRYGGIHGFPGMREEKLLWLLAAAEGGLDRTQEQCDAQERLVAIRVARYGLDHRRTHRTSLMLARTRRDLGELDRARQDLERILGSLDGMDLSADPELRADALLTMADLAERSDDSALAVDLLKRREDEIGAIESPMARLLARGLRVGVMVRAGQRLEALALQCSLVDDLSELIGTDAPETRGEIEDRNALEWSNCIEEAAALRREGDHVGAAERYRRWLVERSAGGTGDRRRELSCSVRIAASLSRAGEYDEADHLLRAAHRDAVAEFGSTDEQCLYALVERARHHARAGDRIQEITCLEELHQLEVTAFGDSSKEALGTWSWLAQAHNQMGNTAAAAQYAQRAIAGCVARWGEEDPYTTEIREAVSGIV